MASDKAPARKSNGFALAGTKAGGGLTASISYSYTQFFTIASLIISLLKLRKVIGGGFPRALLRGRKKHLWVVLLPRLERQGPLSRDFNLEYRWTTRGRETKRLEPKLWNARIVDWSARTRNP